MSTIEPAVQELYVKALLAIARADGEIDAVEGNRLESLVARRFPGLSVPDLAFERPVKPDDVVRGLEGVDTSELGAMFVADALQAVGGNGISPAESVLLLRFGPLFGATTDEINAAIADAHEE